jgi:putative ABC transport system substrate-binding protein
LKKVGWSSILVAALVLFFGVAAEAQQTVKVPRIGFLSSLSPSSITARTESFRQGLHELGYVEGKNIVIEWRYIEGKLDRAPDVVADLVQLKVDALVVGILPGTTD